MPVLILLQSSSERQRNPRIVNRPDDVKEEPDDEEGPKVKTEEPGEKPDMDMVGQRVEGCEHGETRADKDSFWVVCWPALLGQVFNESIVAQC